MVLKNESEELKMQKIKKNRKILDLHRKSSSEFRSKLK